MKRRYPSFPQTSFPSSHTTVMSREKIMLPPLPPFLATRHQFLTILVTKLRNSLTVLFSPSHSSFSPKRDSDKEKDLNDSSVSLKNCSFGSESNSSKEEDVNDSFASPKNSLFGSESDSSNEGCLLFLVLTEPTLR